MLADHLLRSGPPVALTIAGSDSGGGAGIAADLLTFAAHRVFGTFALTAATAQNTEKVQGVVAFEPDFVQLQIDSVIGDFNILATKTGMLATVAIIDSLTERAARDALPSLVVDPVMVSSTGSSLFEGDAAAAYRRLLPYAFVTTPNLAEAEVICERPIRTITAMIEAARELCAYGVQYTVIKGGHLPGTDSVDVVCHGREIRELHTPRVTTSNDHGTGCSLSAAIAANLALGHSPLDAIMQAKTYVTQAISASVDWCIGGGRGPIDHFPTPYDVRTRD